MGDKRSGVLDDNNLRPIFAGESGLFAIFHVWHDVYLRKNIPADKESRDLGLDLYDSVDSVRELETPLASADVHS